MEDNRWLWRIGWLVVIALVLFLIWWLWPPTANPDSVVLDPAARTRRIDVLANDTDLFHRNFFIKDWSNGANGGTVALAPDGHELVYTRPKNSGVALDSFTYSIWTRHGLPSSTSVTVSLAGKQAASAASSAPAPAPASAPAGCPRGETHTSNPSTPLPKQFGNCFAVYFSWRNTKVFSEHAKDVKTMLREIAKQAADKVVLINGYTDTSGEHYMQLSKGACLLGRARTENDGAQGAHLCIRRWERKIRRRRRPPRSWSGSIAGLKLRLRTTRRSSRTPLFNVRSECAPTNSSVPDGSRARHRADRRRFRSRSTARTTIA